MGKYKVVVKYLKEGEIEGEVICEELFEAENEEKAKEKGKEISESVNTIPNKPYEHWVTPIAS